MISLFYLFYFAAGGALIPFLNLYYQQIGMSTRQIGVLAALPTVTVLAAGPLWGVTADAFHLHRRSLPLLAFGVMLPVSGLMWAQGFMVLAVLVLLYAAMNASIIPLADNSVLHMLGDAHANYGRLRLWGAVGFGGLHGWGRAARPTVRAALHLRRLCTHDEYGRPDRNQVCLRLPRRRAACLDGICGVLPATPRWLGFMLAMFMGGICMSILNNYFSIFLKSIGAGEGLIGLGVAAAGLSELPVFWLSPLLLRRWGPRPLLMVAFLMFAVRGVAYSMIQDPRAGRCRLSYFTARRFR